MSSLNLAQIIGHLGKDPETRYTPNGTAVVNFSVATSEKWKDRATGDAKEATEWHRIVAFDKLAEVCGEYLQKGSLVYVAGRIKTRKWQDREGNDRYTTEIHISEMRMLGPKPRDGGGDREQYSEPAAAAAKPPARKPATGTGFDDMDDDIPFVTSSPAFDMVTRKARRMARF